MPDDIWSFEESFWTGGPDAYQRRMDDSCLMVLPGDTGPADAETIRASLADSPRWSEVAMTGRNSIERAGLVILSYKATAQRPGKSEYRALCGSVYAPRDGGWALVYHQQTPLP